MSYADSAGAARPGPAPAVCRSAPLAPSSPPPRVRGDTLDPYRTTEILTSANLYRQTENTRRLQAAGICIYFVTLNFILV